MHACINNETIVILTGHCSGVLTSVGTEFFLVLDARSALNKNCCDVISFCSPIDNPVMFHLTTVFFGNVNLRALKSYTIIKLPILEYVDNVYIAPCISNSVVLIVKINIFSMSLSRPGDVTLFVTKGTWFPNMVCHSIRSSSNSK